MTDEPTPEQTTPLLKTPLHALHAELGARMTAFAGYDMPLQYALGVMKEHLQTRQRAGLFDVSHMGQAALRPRSGDVADAAIALERLAPMDFLALKSGRQRYGLLTNDTGGVIDDFMAANLGDRFFLVVNAARKAVDLPLIAEATQDLCTLEPLEDRALLALQGPAAEAALAAAAPDIAERLAAARFMDVIEADVAGAPCLIARAGYTGEDGFEISVAADQAEPLARALLAHEAVEPIGLGARDSLRLEAGLCLYGSDLDETTSPVEAALEWAVQKARRQGGAREGGFPGAAHILSQFASGAARRRVGLKPEGRAPIRQGAALYASEDAAEPVGLVTSGVFGPSLEAPVAMGYVSSDRAAIGTRLFAEVRGKRLPATVAETPFIAPTYKRA